MEKSQQPVRWLVLFLSCVLMIGNYYCFDNPAALKSQLQQHFNKIPKDRYEFLFVRSDENGSPRITNLLYTLYSIPNILLPFFGGVLVDRFGARVMLFAFSTAILAGQVIFSTGCSLSSFNMMLVRVVFFREMNGKNSHLRELALALGINLSVARLGSVINNELSPVIAQASGVSSALWVGVIMCVMSTCTVLLVIPIDKRAEKVAQANLKAGSAAAESIHFSDIKHFRPAFWLLALSCLVVYGCVIPFNSVASSLLMERDFFKEPPSLCRRCGDGLYIGEIDCREIAPGCPSVPPYGWPLPLLSANCTIKEPQDQWNCSTSPPLIDDSKINCDDEAWKLGPLTKLYCATKADAARKAATPMSIPYIISAVISPFLGFAVDHIGLRAFLALFNHDERYIPGVELLFVSFGVVGSLVGLALNVVDYQNGSILNGTNASAKKKVSLMLDEEALDNEALLAAEH
ncbi:hypothetical protein BBJ28_00011853 [Nothophytophthora sp. Chile5]|nr:hypothetical protein BBJ28_00011853 [Nothophytophthora sp. Chile5]